MISIISRHAVAAVVAVALGAVAATLAAGAAAATEDPPRAIRAAHVPPTRLVAGPQIFRISGADDGTRYLMLFRLNHYPGPRNGAWRGTKFGSYVVAGRPLYGEIDELDRYPHFCIQYVAYNSGPTRNRELDRVKNGRRVSVTLQPGDTAPDGSWTPGKEYVRRPVLRQADTSFRDPRDRDALRRIGCLRKHMVD